MNQLINDGGVCKTALATPGLLNIMIQKKVAFIHRTWELKIYSFIIIYNLTLSNATTLKRQFS